MSMYKATKLKDGVLTPVTQPTLCQTELTAEADINLIAKRFLQTGLLPQLPPLAYGDFTAVPVGTAALAAVREAYSKFEKLPESVQALCKGDPAVLVELADTPEGRKRLEKVGLSFEPPKKPEPPAPPPVKVEIVPAPEPPAKK